MRILWLSHLIPYPPKGGVLQRSYNLVRETARHHELSVLAFNQVDLISPLFASLEAGLQEAQQALDGYCERFEYLPIACDESAYGKHWLALKSLFTPDPYNINWLKSAQMRARFQAWLAAQNFDLIHYDTISLVPYWLQARDIPATLDHHNIESHMLLRRCEHEPQPLKRFYYQQEGRRLARYEQRWCKEFDLNMTCSEEDKQRLLKLCPSARVETVPNGVDVEFFQPQPERQQEQRLVFVGTMNFYPNVQAMHFLLDEVWPQLKTLCPEVELDIAGANPPADLVNKAQGLAGVRVRGFVDDIRGLMAEASVYVCPIMDGGGTKLKVLDALAMGKALVAHPIACEGINVTDGLNVSLASSAEDFVQAIQTLLADKTKRLALGTEARRLAEEQYAYAAIGKQLATLFSEVVS